MTVGQPIDLSTARAYVEYLAELQTSNAKLMEYEGPTPGQYVLEHGREYQPVLRDVRQGESRQCFANAYHLASGSRRTWRYVEGWAINLIPTEHAWCVDAKGNIGDPTWGKDGKSYFGVELPLKLVERVQLATTVYGVFCQWWNWELVLRCLNSGPGPGKQPTREQLEALRVFAAHNGHNWKSALRFCWETGRYKDFNGTERQDLLQQVRNSFGPSWLVRFRLKGGG